MSCEAVFFQDRVLEGADMFIDRWTGVVLESNMHSGSPRECRRFSERYEIASGLDNNSPATGCCFPPAIILMLLLAVCTTNVCELRTTHLRVPGKTSTVDILRSTILSHHHSPTLAGGRGWCASERVVEPRDSTYLSSPLFHSSLLLWSSISRSPKVR